MRNASPVAYSHLASVYWGWRVRARRFGAGGRGVLRRAVGSLGSNVVRKLLEMNDFGLLAKGTEGSDALADFVRGSRQVALHPVSETR